MKIKALLVLCLFICIGLSQVNAQQPKLDQLKLVQQITGSWKFEISKDTSMIIEVKPYGKCLVETDYLEVNGKKIFDSQWNYGYSPETDQFKFFAVYADGKYQTWIGSFTSEKKWVQQLVQDFNPEKVLMISELNFDGPDSYTAFQRKADGQKIGRDYKGTRIKK